MTRQFRRYVRVVIGVPGEEGRAIEGLRIGFEVIKQDGQALNTAKIKIWGASDDTVALASRRDASVQLIAGYGGVGGLLFLGTITRVISTRADAERILEIESGDGQAAAGKPAALTLGGGTSLKDTLGPLAGIAQIGLDLAGIDANAPLQAPRGVSLSGPALGQVNRIAKLNKLDWTIEDNVLRLFKRGEASTLPALLVTPNTGLIGAPKPGTAGRIELRMLASSEVRLRRIIRLESRDVTGWFLVRRVKHTGDSGWASEYYSDIEATPIKARTP